MLLTFPSLRTMVVVCEWSRREGGIVEFLKSVLDGNIAGRANPRNTCAGIAGIEELESSQLDRGGEMIRMYSLILVPLLVIRSRCVPLPGSCPISQHGALTILNEYRKLMKARYHIAEETQPSQWDRIPISPSSVSNINLSSSPNPTLTLPHQTHPNPSQHEHKPPHNAPKS